LSQKKQASSDFIGKCRNLPAYLNAKKEKCLEITTNFGEQHGKLFFMILLGLSNALVAGTALLAVNLIVPAFFLTAFSVLSFFILLGGLKKNDYQKPLKQCQMIFINLAETVILLPFSAMGKALGPPLFIVGCVFGLIAFFLFKRYFSGQKFKQMVETLIHEGNNTKIKPAAGNVFLCNRIELNDEKEPTGTLEPEILPQDDRFLHMLIIGATGSGKTSQILLPMTLQDIKNEESGVTIIEPKGDYAVKAAMMAKEYNRPCFYFNPAMDDCPFFNPMAGVETEIIENMVLTFKMLNPDSSTYFLDMNETLMRNSLKVLKRLDANEGVDGKWATMINLGKLMQNGGGWGRDTVTKFSRITTKTSEEAKENADIAAWFLNDYLAERSKSYENTSGVRSQVTKITSNQYLRKILNPDIDKGQKNDIDFDQHLADGGVIAISTAQDVLGGLSSYLGYFLILQFQSCVFRRPGNEKTRRPNYLYIDEFQAYANEGFSQMLQQGRSYRVAAHLATQARAQMGSGREAKKFIEVVSTNARNVIVFPGGSKEDAEYYSKTFGEFERVRVVTGISQKKFSPLMGGFDRLGHPTESIKEERRMVANFSYDDIRHRKFGEITYQIVQNKTLQRARVGSVQWIDYDLDQKLNEMIEIYESQHSYSSKRNSASNTDTDIVWMESMQEADTFEGIEDLAGGEVDLISAPDFDTMPDDVHIYMRDDTDELDDLESEIKFPDFPNDDDDETFVILDNRGNLFDENPDDDDEDGYTRRQAEADDLI